MESEPFLDRARARSFGAVAANYDRYRPSYPASLIDDIARLGSDVVDVGCGTGKAAVMLAARGLHVLGVEADAEMAEVARCAHHLAVEVSPFESWEPDGRIFDVLTCAQAWHWVDPVLGVRKAAAVLRPGGSAVCFWNHGTPNAMLAEALSGVYREHAPELLSGVLDSDRREHYQTYRVPFAEAPEFTNVTTRRYPWQAQVTAREWVGRTWTHSDHLQLSSERRAALAAAVIDALTTLGPTFTMSYESHALFAVRNAE